MCIVHSTLRDATTPYTERYVQQLKAKMKIILSILVSIWVNQIIGQDNMNIIAKERINEYINELNEVRKNPALLSNYEFENRNSNHYNRLKLNIAMFNDFRYSDYLIAKFLFEQESNLSLIHI